MNYKINDIISKNILGQDTFVKVTDIKVEEEETLISVTLTKVSCPNMFLLMMSIIL